MVRHGVSRAGLSAKGLEKHQLMEPQDLTQHSTHRRSPVKISSCWMKQLFVTRSAGGENLGAARALCYSHLHTQDRPNKRLGHSHKSLRMPSAIL